MAISIVTESKRGACTSRADWELQVGATVEDLQNLLAGEAWQWRAATPASAGGYAVYSKADDQSALQPNTVLEGRTVYLVKISAKKGSAAAPDAGAEAAAAEAPASSKAGRPPMVPAFMAPEGSIGTLKEYEQAEKFAGALRVRMTRAKKDGNAAEVGQIRAQSAHLKDLMGDYKENNKKSLRAGVTAKSLKIQAKIERNMLAWHRLTETTADHAYGESGAEEEDDAEAAAEHRPKKPRK